MSKENERVSTENNNDENKSVVRKMLIAVLAGLITGILCMMINRNYGENSQIWQFLDFAFFQDISETDGFQGIGIFYIIGQIFMRMLQAAIVPLVLTSLILAICQMEDAKKLGRIAIRTFAVILVLYVVVAAIAGTIAFGVKKSGAFTVDLPNEETADITTMQAYNPLNIFVNAVPFNIFEAFSNNNSIISVCVVAIIIGICMLNLGDKAAPLRRVVENLNDIVELYLNFVINKVGPIAIYCLISRAFAIYGLDYIKPTFAWMITTIVVSLLLVVTVYPLAIKISTGLNPIPFMRKMIKVGMIASATNSSASALPLNMKTNVEELGCSEEITSFVLPMGMTVNMTGTTAMHMIAVTFIACASGIDITPSMLVTAAIISIGTAMGTPAIPVAGTTMIYVVMMGIGLNSEAAIIAYSLVLAMNYIPGMAVILLNVFDDATVNVIVSHQEGALDEEVYYKEDR